MTHQKTTDGDVRIRISGLSNGIHEYHFAVTPTALGLAENFRSTVEIDAHLDKTTRQIFLRMVIRAAGEYQCDRCLETFEQKLSTEYGMLYVYNKADAQATPEDEVVVLQPDQVSIDATEDVRQMILFSVPLKLLCREECRGLCPHCGSNLNTTLCECKQETIDPRWQNLQGLINN